MNRETPTVLFHFLVTFINSILHICIYIYICKTQNTHTHYIILYACGGNNNNRPNIIRNHERKKYICICNFHINFPIASHVSYKSSPFFSLDFFMIFLRLYILGVYIAILHTFLYRKLFFMEYFYQFMGHHLLYSHTPNMLYNMPYGRMYICMNDVHTPIFHFSITISESGNIFTGSSSLSTMTSTLIYVYRS